MTLQLLVLVSVSGALVAMGLAGLVVPPRGRLAGRVRPYTVEPRAVAGRSADVVAHETRPASTLARLVVPPLVALAGGLARRVDRGSDAAVARRLRHAGMELTLEEYRLRVVTQAVLFAAVGALLGVVLVRSSWWALVLATCGLVFGATRWRGRVDRAVAERRERIRLELYTVNQLLAMHVRAGAGPVQAVQRVVDRGSGLVVGELEELLASLHRGVGEPDAFRLAAQRTPEASAARTYELFAASAERGSDLGAALRSLSEDLRDARREELRRFATKRRAGMLVPIIAVLAPVMLLFIAAPIPSMLFGNR